MEIGELYFGQGRTTFTVLHPTGTTREYRHFRDVWDDTIDARVYQGIHFRAADEVGAKLGRDVAAGSTSTRCSQSSKRCRQQAVECGGHPPKRVSSRCGG